MKNFCSLWRATLAALCIALIVPSAEAQLPPGIYSNCDFCLCSEGISPLEMGGSSLRIDSRYTELASQFSSGKAVPNPMNAQETYFTNSLSVTEGITNGLCATVIVPFARKTESNVDPAIAPVENFGIGDISVLARYTLLHDHHMGDTRIVSVTGGIKLANGSTALISDNAPADPDIQLGTGTTDFLVGASGVLGFDDWSIGTNVLAGVRGFGSGANGHVYGNNLNYDVTARYRIYQPEANIPGSFDPTIFAAAGIRGEWRGYELQDGDKIPDSGGNVMYVTPGAQVFFTPRLSLDAVVWIPVVHALNGDQLGETIKLLAGLQMGI